MIPEAAGCVDRGRIRLLLPGEGRPRTGGQYCLARRVSRAQTQVSKWSLESGEQSGAGERQGRLGFRTTCHGLPGVGPEGPACAGCV